MTNKMVEDKKEYDLRLQEYAQLLDIRAERIKVICHQKILLPVISTIFTFPVLTLVHSHQV